MATLHVQAVGHDGLSPTYTDAMADGDESVTGSGVVLHIKNGDTDDHTVTLAMPGTVDGLAIEDRTVTVPAGKELFIPVLSQYRNPKTTVAEISYDAVKSMTVAVLRVG